MANSNVANHNKFELENPFSTGENFEELFSQSIQNEKKEGTVVKGEIIAIDNDTVVVDIGLKSEGRISIKEFYSDGSTPDLNVGDEVEVFLEKVENRNGKIVLSAEKALKEKTWVVLEQLHERTENVDGTIFGKVKGGFTVDLRGIVAFLPGSQVDIRPIKDITPLMNILQPFQILKMDKKQGNIVVSRRAILEESRVEARNELLATINEGQILEGVVKNITDYGAFIDLGSVDGLLHVTDISWSRISHPSEVLSLGQTVKVQVIKYNQETKRISLGMKQLEDNPWKGIEERYPKGVKFKGKITNIADYGAFIELEPGIEGLVYVSEISWVKSNQHPKKLVSIGQEVEFMVLDIDTVKHRISLGIKQCSENPWEIFASKHPIGTILEGEVKNIVEFGIFIGLEENIDGLIHMSDLDWNEETAAEELKKYNKGDKIKVIILSMDIEKERISLGIKQLSDDPFEDVVKDLKKGAVVTCAVTDVTEDGIEVEVCGMKSFIKRSDLSSDKVEQRSERFAIGDRIDAKLTALDKANRKVTLSIKALEVEEQKKAIAEYGSTDSGASLGDILGAALNKSEENKG
ncbi:MAG: 30S ribosomal protein S1 [Alphaproteobacteria bacterium]